MCIRDSCKTIEVTKLSYYIQRSIWITVYMRMGTGLACHHHYRYDHVRFALVKWSFCFIIVIVSSSPKWYSLSRGIASHQYWRHCFSSILFSLARPTAIPIIIEELSTAFSTSLLLENRWKTWNWPSNIMGMAVLNLLVCIRIMIGWSPLSNGLSVS